MEAKGRREGNHYNSRFMSIRSQQGFSFSSFVFVFSFSTFFLFRKQVRILGSEYLVSTINLYFNKNIIMHWPSLQPGHSYVLEGFLSNFFSLVNAPTFSWLSSTQTKTSISSLFHSLVTNSCEFPTSSSRTGVPNQLITRF